MPPGARHARFYITLEDSPPGQTRPPEHGQLAGDFDPTEGNVDYLAWNLKMVYHYVAYLFTRCDLGNL